MNTETKSENTLLELFKNSLDGIILGSPDGTIIEANNAALEMFGYSFDEIKNIGRELIFDQDSSMTEALEIREKKSRVKCELIGIRKNGERFPCEISSTIFRNERGEMRSCTILNDITRRRKAEDEMERLMKNTAENFAEVSQNNNDLKQFSYVTSHNLRAPIANLLGLTSLIEQYDIPDPSLTQILNGIRQSALMFDDTVKDLTKVLVIKDQKNILKEKVSLITVIDKVSKQLNLASNQDMEIDYKFEIEPIVSFTNAYMESILLNLFTNAIKYQSPTRKLKINLLFCDAGNFVELRFSDNGIGIDIERHKEKLFKLYQRFHLRTEGKGLGLYLIKSQLDALEGTIDVVSKIDVGTTFIIRFKK